MARVFEDFHEVPDHGKVGYTLSKRGKFYFVRFIGPKGKYERKSTSMKEKNEARVEANRLILRAYRPQDFQKPIPVTWDEALLKLQEAMTVNGNRPVTVMNYAAIFRAVRRVLPKTIGPLDIGPDEALRFKNEYLSHGYKKAEDGTVYHRSKMTFNTYLRSLRSIWRKWLKRLKIVRDNPWEGVDYAQVDRKLPEAADNDVLAEFFQFIKALHPGWDMPILFLQTKCLLGCRLMDLCLVRSNQLKNRAIDLDPEQLKNRDFRRVPLPADLYHALDQLKGPVYLWERYNDQLRERLRAQGKPISRVGEQFSPKALYGFIAHLFNRFQNSTGKKLTSHMLRKRAVTLLVGEGVSAEMVAKMLGMDVQTARRYYVDMDKLDAGAKLEGFADKLIPPA